MYYLQGLSFFYNLLCDRILRIGNLFTWMYFCIILQVLRFVMNELPVIWYLRLRRGAWDRHGENIANCYKECMEKFVTSSQKQWFDEEYGKILR